MTSEGGPEEHPGGRDEGMAVPLPDEFDVPPPDGSLGADEVELEARYDTEIWDGDQGPLAEDLVELREHQRLGLEFGLLGHLLGADEVDRLFHEACDRGDYDRAEGLMWEEAAVDPTNLIIAIFGSVEAGEAAFEEYRRRSQPDD